MKHYKLTTALFIALTLYLPSSFAEPAKFTDLTIVVSSCDKYAPLWEPFFASLFKQWPSLNTDNKQVPILLIANSQQYSHPRVNMVNIPQEISWADNMLTALDKVKTKYVLIALDDYWISKPVDEARLLELYAAMQQEDIGMLQTSYNTLEYQNGQPHPNLSGVAYRDKFAHYKVSLQMAIWETETLKTLLRPGEDPWTFELAGSIRSHGYPKQFLTITANEPIYYINASHLGHITQPALDYAQNNNIPFQAENFPRLRTFNWRIAYKSLKHRSQKIINFAKNPGMFYEFRNT